MQETLNLKLNRILAALIDGLIILLITWGSMAYPFVELIKGISNNAVTVGSINFLIITFFVGMLFSILYLFISSLIFKNATLGMKICHIAFTNYDGKNPSKTALFYRSSMIIFCFILSLGLVVVSNFVTVLHNEFGRNFHDVFLKMKVVSSYDL